MKQSAFILVAMAAMLVAKAAHAGEVVVRLPSCDPSILDGDELLAGLRHELEPDGLVPRAISAAEPIPEAELVIEMACTSDADHVVLRAQTADGRQTSRRMALADLTPRTRPSGIAVIAAETIRAASAVEAPKPPPPRPSFEREEIPIDRPRTSPRRPSLVVEATAEGRLFVQRPTPLVGGAFGARVGRIHGAIHALRGSTDDALGELSLTLALASIGFDVSRWERPSVALGFGPRIGAGIAFAGASAAPGAYAKDDRAPYVDAAAEMTVRIRVARAWWLTAEADAGYARGIVQMAQSHVASRADGAFTVLRLGVAFDR